MENAWWRKCPRCGGEAGDQYCDPISAVQSYWCFGCGSGWDLCSRDSADSKTWCHLVHNHRGNHKNEHGNTWADAPIELTET